MKQLSLTVTVPEGDPDNVAEVLCGFSKLLQQQHAVVSVELTEQLCYVEAL